MIDLLLNCVLIWIHIDNCIDINIITNFVTKVSSVHKLLSMLRATVASAEFYLPASSIKAVVNGGMYTVSLMYCHKEN